LGRFFGHPDATGKTGPGLSNWHRQAGDSISPSGFLSPARCPGLGLELPRWGVKTEGSGSDIPKLAIVLRGGILFGAATLIEGVQRIVNNYPENNTAIHKIYPFL
jgi:hypothetical protein